MEKALEKYVSENDVDYLDLDPRERAARRVEVFLKMMKGEVDIPIEGDVRRKYQKLPRTGEWSPSVSIGDNFNGPDLYEADYLGFSAIPNRSPDEVPESAKRITGKRSNKGPYLNLDMDLIM